MNDSKAELLFNFPSGLKIEASGQELSTAGPNIEVVDVGIAKVKSHKNPLLPRSALCSRAFKVFLALQSPNGNLSPSRGSFSYEPHSLGCGLWLDPKGGQLTASWRIMGLSKEGCALKLGAASKYKYS